MHYSFAQNELCYYIRMKNLDTLLKEIFPNKTAAVKERLLGGMMNETNIITCEGKDYVLFMPQGNANDVVDRNEEKFVQKIASDLGITSKNIYFDVKTGVKCHEFISGVSLNKIDEFDYDAVAKMLKTFHSSKTKSHNDYKPFARLSEYYNLVCGFTKLGDDFYELLDTLKTNQIFLEEQELVLSHNDFQRSNIVKASDGDYYMIDFEFVGNNDEIYDIAAFGNNSVSEGRKLLDAYFNYSPTADQVKRYYLWRIFISLQWSLMALIKDHNGEGKIHGIDFLGVSKFFIANAKEANDNLKDA